MQNKGYSWQHWIRDYSTFSLFFSFSLSLEYRITATMPSLVCMHSWKKEDFVFPIFSHREAIIEFLITITQLYSICNYFFSQEIMYMFMYVFVVNVMGINYSSAYINVYPSIWDCKLININVMCISVAIMFKNLAILCLQKQLRMDNFLRTLLKFLRIFIHFRNPGNPELHTITYSSFFFV